MQEPQGARCGSAVAVVTEGQNREGGQGQPWPASVGYFAVKCGLTQVRAFGGWQHGHKHVSSSMFTPGQGCIHDQRRGSARPPRGNGLHPRDTHFDRRRTRTKSARRPRSCGVKATSSSDQEPSLHGIVIGGWQRTGQNHRTGRPASFCVRWRRYSRQRVGAGAVHPIPSLPHPLRPGRAVPVKVLSIRSRTLLPPQNRTRTDGFACAGIPTP